MADLISREYVLGEYDRQHKGPPGRARKIMQEAPAVDAEPVVHGRWTYFNGIGNGSYQCSECSHWVNARTTYRNYCPNCGAKMDEEADA